MLTRALSGIEENQRKRKLNGMEKITGNKNMDPHHNLGTHYIHVHIVDMRECMSVSHGKGVLTCSAHNFKIGSGDRQAGVHCLFYLNIERCGDGRH